MTTADAPRHRFTRIPGTWSVVRLPPDAPVPAWALSEPDFLSITRTPEELCIVASTARVPDGWRTEPGWSLIKLLGPFPFDAVGVLASVASPLAEAGVSILAISTFDTDYVLVRTAQAAAACEALIAAGHEYRP